MYRFYSIRQLKCTLALAPLGLLSALGSAHAEPLDPALDPAANLTAKPAGLTADQVAQKATASSWSAEQKRHEVAAAQAQLDKALYDFFPRLTLSGSYARLSKVDGGSLGNIVLAPNPGPVDPGSLSAVPLKFDSLQNSTSGTASLGLSVSDYLLRLPQAHSGAKAQLVSSQHSLRATERKVTYEARALYYDWVKAELNAAVAQQNLELSNENLARLRALAAADSASEADVARVEATVASSELVLVQAKNLAALQRERVGIAMHDGKKRDYQIGEDLRQAPAPRGDLDDIAALTRLAQQNRPELKAAAAQIAAYQKQADVARSAAFPRLDASAQATIANPNQRYFPQQDEYNSSWQLGLQLTYAPNDTLSGLSQAAAAKAKAAAAQAQRSELLDGVRSEVTDAVLAHRNAQASLTSTARRLKAAETSYRARRERYLADKATQVELTEAQTELFNAKLDAVQAQVSVRVARARLAYVTGSER